MCSAYIPPAALHAPAQLAAATSAARGNDAMQAMG